MPARNHTDKSNSAAPPERAPSGLLVRWMAAQALRHPWRVLWLFLLNVLLLGLTLGALSLTGLMIDVLRYAVDERAPYPKYPYAFMAPGPQWTSLRGVLWIGAVIIGLAAIRGGLRFAAAMAQGQLVQAVLTRLRTIVYDKLQRLSFRFFDANETGSLINRATSDVSGVATFSEFALIQVTMLGVTLTVYLGYMLSIHTMLTLIALATTPLLLAASLIFSRVVRPAYEQNRKLFDAMVLALAENIQGHHVVKGFALERPEINKFRQANDNLRSQQRWLFKRSAGYSALVTMLVQLNLVVVLLAGGYMVITSRLRGETNPALTIGGLIVFAQLLNMFSGQVGAIANVANTLQASLTAAHRVYEVLQARIEIQSKPDARPLFRAAGQVKFVNVSFGYKKNEPVLHHICFEAQPGQCIAILGATGCGKSSLLGLIPRFYDPDVTPGANVAPGESPGFEGSADPRPLESGGNAANSEAQPLPNGRGSEKAPQAGHIEIDHIDIRDLKLDDLRRNIGLVFQESFLFSNTVWANISFGHPGATKEQIERAARIAQAHDFIMELEKGYDTVIGEQGSTLSGGQRQRLALARAIVLEPSILILDDATAAIDPDTEQEIMAAMDAAMQGRTTFVVAHRLSTLRRADLVLVLERGRIVQRGTHEELMHTDGHYRAVARMQVADLESQWIIQARKWVEGEAATPMVDPEAMP